MKLYRILAIFFVVLALSALSAPADKAPRSVPLAFPADIYLDGADWRLLSFSPGEGEKNGAFAESFDDASARIVSVPGEIQHQVGLKGMQLFQESKDLSLINNREWWYRKTFLSPAVPADKNLRLIFDGADYFASVWLNGHKLGDHEGSFWSFDFDVTPYLRKSGLNTLAIRVTHPLAPRDRGLGEYVKGAFTQIVPWGMVFTDPPYTLTSSWDPLADYGNATFAMGLWRGVHLRVEDSITLHGIHAETESLNDDGSATLTLSGVVQNQTDTVVNRSVRLTLAPKNFSGAPMAVPEQTIEVPGRGTATFRTTFKVADAKLWWTWDLGPQNLYKLTAEVGETAVPGAKSALIDTASVVFGIRTIRRDAGMVYYLNGKHVFFKGAWYPIADYYTSTVTPAFYRRDLTLYRYANFNSIVNFTIVEKPEFYDLCDELGIVNMIELPFPQFGPQAIVNTGSPRRAPYIATAAEAVRRIVADLRHHPSIIEWVPLAESHDNAAGWGVGDIAFDQSGYDEFADAMRNAILEASPHSIYQASFCDLGEHHFWTAAAGMTFNEDNYQDLFDQQAAFISEYGSNSLSSYQNLGRYLTPEEQWSPKHLDLPADYNVPIDLSAWANITSFHYTGIASLLDKAHRFVDHDIRSPRDFVDDSQLYHSFLVKYAAEAFHRKKYSPVQGIRLWSFVELNPGFHFTIVDYDRVPKIPYWALKSAQAPLSFSFAFKRALESIPGGSPVSIPVWAVNDEHMPRSVSLRAQVADLQGNVLLEKQFRGNLASDSTLQLGSVDWTTPLKPGIYMLRGVMSSENSTEPIINTTYIKVVTPAFAHPHHVLLIGMRKYSAPIADTLRELGLQIDVLDEDCIKQLDAMKDGAALHAKYDLIWLGPFENIWKVLTSDSAPAAIADAVKSGTAFIHTGGESSFHGGFDHAANIQLSVLGDILPVQISDRIDLVLPPIVHSESVRQWSENHTRLYNIKIELNKSAWTDTGYSASGLAGFNSTTLRPGSSLLWSVYGRPLLASGSYGRGRTFAFTGFTPSTWIKTDGFLDEQLQLSPESEAFFGLACELLSAAFDEPLSADLNALRAEHEKPLFQSLKESPATSLTGTISAVGANEEGRQRYNIEITNGPAYARLVRINLDDALQHNPNIIPLIGDSYFDLLPNERKTITLDWIQQDKGNIAPNLQIEATNAPAIRVTSR